MESFSTVQSIRLHRRSSRYGFQWCSEAARRQAPHTEKNMEKYYTNVEIMSEEILGGPQQQPAGKALTYPNRL